MMHFTKPLPPNFQNHDLTLSESTNELTSEEKLYRSRLFSKIKYLQDRYSPVLKERHGSLVWNFSGRLNCVTWGRLYWGQSSKWLIWNFDPNWPHLTPIWNERLMSLSNHQRVVAFITWKGTVQLCTLLFSRLSSAEFSHCVCVKILVILCHSLDYTLQSRDFY